MNALFDCTMSHSSPFYLKKSSLAFLEFCTLLGTFEINFNLYLRGTKDDLKMNAKKKAEHQTRIQEESHFYKQVYAI